MTEPTPPPDEPIPDQARARIRAELLAATQARPARSQRWVVPLAAAASVALVAGITAWAVRGDGEPDGRDGIGPAGTTTSSSPSPDPVESQTESEASEALSSAADPAPSGSAGDPGECPAELDNVLKGAEQAVGFPPDDDGSTSFWVKGERFVLCDVRAGTTTVHQPLPLEPNLDDVATFRVSSLDSPTKDGYRTIRVAGGMVPEGALAFDVAYTFPDGHIEKATTATDDQGRTWWRMVYEYDAGGGNETKQPMIEVEVTLSGSGFGYTLQWGVDTCAQANHGC